MFRERFLLSMKQMIAKRFRTLFRMCPCQHLRLEPVIFLGSMGLSVWMMKRNRKVLLLFEHQKNIPRMVLIVPSLKILT